jgi:hypothetical protein
LKGASCCEARHSNRRKEYALIVIVWGACQRKMWSPSGAILDSQRETRVCDPLMSGSRFLVQGGFGVYEKKWRL